MLKQRIRWNGGQVLDKVSTLSKDYLDFFVLPPPPSEKERRRSDFEEVKRQANTAERRGVRVVTREWISSKMLE